MDRVLYLFIVLLSKALNLLPYRTIDSLASLLGLIFYRVAKRRRNDLLVNLDIAFPSKSCKEKVELGVACSKHFAYIALEFIKNLDMKRDEMESLVRIKNEHIIDDALKKNRPIILITAHFGNWEIGSLVSSLRVKSLTAIGRESGNVALDRLIKKSRERFNVKLISKHGALKHMIKEIRCGGAIGILVDQNTSDDEGILVDFFGHKARHTPVASLLAKRFDAIIIPAFSYRDKENYIIDVHPPLEANSTLGYQEDIDRLTQAQADATKRAILKSPSEYFWFHRRWKNQYEELYHKPSPCN